MVTYISLINWTDQGIKNVKETLKRGETATKAAERLGGRITDLHWTQGSYDLVFTSEFPDEESAQVFFLALGASGSVRSQTLRAFSAAEMTAIIDKMP